MGSEARFNYPEGLYFDTDHQVLYVVEFVSTSAPFICRFIGETWSRDMSLLEN